MPIPVPWDWTDGFLAAYWRRPDAYLEPDIRAAASGIARLPDAVVERAVQQLREDLNRGLWHTQHCDLLELPALDVGYRLAVSE